MTYLRLHSRLSRGARILIGILAAILAVAALIEWRAPYFFPGLAATIARPYWRVAFSIESGALRSPGELLNENEALKRELAGLQAAMASSSVVALMQENADLRSILGRASTTQPLTLAAVLIRPPATPYDEIVIDLGAKDGVASDTPVLAPGNIPIGRVIDVQGQTSRAILLSSPGLAYDVLIGASGVPATAIGRGGGQYQAKMPHGSAVSPGDVAIDPLLGPRPFGTVVSVVSDPSSPFDTAVIVSPVDPYGLRWVLLNLKKGK